MPVDPNAILGVRLPPSPLEQQMGLYQLQNARAAMQERQALLPLKVQQAQLEQQQLQQQMQARHILNSAYQNHFSNGDLDINGVASELAKGGQGALIPDLLEKHAKYQQTLTAAAEMNAKLEDTKAELAAGMGQHAQTILDAGGPDALENAGGYLVIRTKQLQQKGLMTDDDATQAATLANPSNEAQLRSYIKALQSPMLAAAQRKLMEPTKLGQGESLIIPGTGQVLAQNAPKPTLEMDASRAIELTSKQARGIPVSAEDKAWLDAYQKIRPTPEATAERQIAQFGEMEKRQASQFAEMEKRQQASIGAQVAQQARAQNFQEGQAARREYTDKVATPYQTALASAQTLRDTVAAAKAGNKVAANLQQLETAMSAIRSQGLNRINMTEIGLAGDAGSLWDQIVGKVGKLTAGQAVPADLQKDMLEFAGILEKSATLKYQKGRKSIQQTYGNMPLPDESVTVPTAGTAKGDPLGIR